MVKGVDFAPVVPNIIVAVNSLPKSGKSHFMLTFPKPLMVFSFDIGLEPVLKKFPGQDIIVKTYPLPIIETVRAVGFKKDILGIWQAFVEDYRKVIADTQVRSIGLDTATALYEICRIARTGELGRELDPVEYGDVYLRMKALVQQARLSGQNLVLTHYLKDVYVGREPTGEKVLDGWKHTEGEVDVVLMLRRERSKDKGKPGDKVILTIKDNRYDMALNGWETELLAPGLTSYDDLATALGILE